MDSEKLMTFVFRVCAKDLQQEEVEVHMARCHPREWFGGEREGKAVGGGEGSKAERGAGGGSQNTDGREDIVGSGVRSGDLRLEEGIVKRSLDLEQPGDAKSAKLDGFVEGSDLVEGISPRRGQGGKNMALEMAQLNKEEVVRRLNSWGPEQKDFITNGFVLKLLLAHMPWVRRPFISFLARVLGIHVTWLNSKNFVLKHKMYLSNSLHLHRAWLEDNPDQEWRYLMFLRPGGNLYCPGERLPLPTPHPLGLLVRHLTHQAEVEAKCGYCSRSGKLPLCGCLAVSYCGEECQLRDTDHVRLCEQAGLEVRGKAVLPPATTTKLRTAFLRERERLLKTNKRKTLLIRRLRAEQSRTYHGALVRDTLGQAPQKKGRQLVAASLAPGDQLLRMVRQRRHGKLTVLDVLNLHPPVSTQVCKYLEIVLNLCEWNVI